MPVIPEMDEYVNWDLADARSGMGAAAIEPLQTPIVPPPSGDPMHDLDLVLENVDGDDFSFWALQHYENNVEPSVDPFAHGLTDVDMAFGTAHDQDRASGGMEENLETPETPCNKCHLNGYQCKRIPEGQYKGYCTSCVALRCECSFGLVSENFPYNPWPVMGDHPEAIVQEDVVNADDTAGTLALGSASGSASNGANSPKVPAGPKTGARFSRESVKILKNWLSTHSKHPYPNDEEKEMLQKQTGLNKTQITNWLANARRRNKNSVAQRSTSPGVRNWTNAIDIPQRRSSSGALANMNPLQRWQHSPPENEPASVTAIAQAVNASSSISSSGFTSPYSLNFTDDGSARSTISSINTSHSSGGSFASAYSHRSRGSFGSQGSMSRGRRRRRRRAPPALGGNSFHTPLKQFQCTFCTATFRTKHDWQRHEKSLHLSLERWVCTPDGPCVPNPDDGNRMSCVFCGKADPDEAHIDSHNHSACQERSLAERTFYRKDHLVQHLRLVHSVKFASWSMEAWKCTTPEIRSRCGFCGILMDTWTIRVDHLAEHFKKGKSMADWKGDWGFEDRVLDIVENSIPPYLIHDERNSPDPYEASAPAAALPRNAFELVKERLQDLVDDRQDKGTKAPTDDELLLCARTTIQRAEELSHANSSSAPSWFRDLLFSSEQAAADRGAAGFDNGTSPTLKIAGKDGIFENDPMETELHSYVKARRLLGLTAMDSELQTEACHIIRRMDEASSYASDEVTQFLARLVNQSTAWLASFRQRAHLPRSEDLGDESNRSKDPTTIDSTIHNFSRLETELAEFVRQQRLLGLEPSDEDLQRQARITIYEFDDGWNQTAADDAVWLAGFKQRHGVGTGVVSTTTAEAVNLIDLGLTYPTSTAAGDDAVWSQLLQQPLASATTSSSYNSNEAAQVMDTVSSDLCGLGPGAIARAGTSLLADANCYMRLARELKRFVATTMSPNNPNCHVPTDEELQYQARWICFEDDDPWNQTAADNAEWLRRFKRDAGILTDPSLPGLPPTMAWSIEQGGSGFAPPYLFPNPNKPEALTPFSDNSELSITMRARKKPFVAPGATANKFVRSLTSKNRHKPPGSVFCSRELEEGLVRFVECEVMASGGMPSAEAVAAEARRLLSRDRTPADDNVLLTQFMAMMKRRFGFAQTENSPESLPAGSISMSASSASISPTATTAPGMGAVLDGITGDGQSMDMSNVLADMDFEFNFGDMLEGGGFPVGLLDGMDS